MKSGIEDRQNRTAEEARNPNRAGQGRRLGRNYRFALALLAWVTALVPAAPSSARPKKLRDPRTRLTLTVHVYNYARVSRGLLRKAEREAARIIGGAGVETIWLDCTASSLGSLRTQGGPRTDCSWNPGHGADATLQILNRSDYDGAALNQGIFGYAYSPLLAAVLFDRVADLADAKGYTGEASLILGDIMAHEIGHLFLDPDAHSRTGIMCSEWGDAQLQRGLTGGLMFTPDQSARIRAAIEAKTKTVRRSSCRCRRESSRSQITLRVYNYAIAPGLLYRAERVATVILNRAGIDVAWIDCPLTAAEFESYPACNRPIGRTDFIFRILTRIEAKRFSKSDDALGQSLDCLNNQGGCSAYIFYREIPALASVAEASEFQLLGHVMAHEIGHMLLGRGHTVNGLMRARWNFEDLQATAQSALFFTRQQSHRMSDALRITP